MNEPSPDTLLLELPLEVPFSKFIEAEEHFRDLIQDVARHVIESKSDPVKWVVTRAEKGSLRLYVQARPANSKIQPSAMPEATRAVTDGLRSLARGDEPPHYFSPKAIDKARKLASLDLGIKVGGVEQEPIDVTGRLVAQIDSVLGEPLRSIGRVEGTLERINLHEKRSFTVWDRLTGQGVECNFGQRITTKHVTDAAERRVSVYGEILYSREGNPLSMTAHEIEVLPSDADLPSAEDVRGILG